MFSQDFIQTIVNGLVYFATDMLLPIMCMMFVIGVALRALIYYTIKREDWFARQFQKRVHAFFDTLDDTDNVRAHILKSFYVTCKMLLEKTYYELFTVRSIMKRRKPGVVLDMSDRVFLIQPGAARLVKDTLKQIKYLKHGKYPPKMLEISKSIFQNNPCFNKVFGVIPANLFNDMLNILPGIFVIGGIFGTFLGIMKGLPELGKMDLTDIEGTKMIMDDFLLKISFSMSTSIVGIVLSVGMSVVNTVLSPEKLFVDIVNRFENCLDSLWNVSKDNMLPEQIADFNEHRDPLEALAEDAVRKELEKHAKWLTNEEYHETIKKEKEEIQEGLESQKSKSEQSAQESHPEEDKEELAS